MSSGRTSSFDALPSRVTGLAVAILIALSGIGAEARADPLVVMSAGAVGGALKDLADDYTKATGTKVTLVFGNVGMIQDRLKSGETADVVILSAAAIGANEKSGGLAAGSVATLGRTGMGLAVKAGAAKPDITTPASFKAALLAAKSIAYSDPAGGGSSGIYFDGLIQKLGIADEIRRKAVLIRGGSAADWITSGEAEMAVQNVSELMHVAGVQLLGPFPAEYQNEAVYTAGVSAKSAQPENAQAFVGYITRADAAGVWKEAGFEP
jgi:molybdate transport system substrate-binding protein